MGDEKFFFYFFTRFAEVPAAVLHRKKKTSKVNVKNVDQERENK